MPTLDFISQLTPTVGPGIYISTGSTRDDFLCIFVYVMWNTQLMPCTPGAQEKGIQGIHDEIQW